VGREDEHHAAVDGRQEREGAVGGQALTGDGDVDALGAADAGGGAIRGVEAADLIAPGPGGVDEDAGADGELLPGEVIDEGGATGPTLLEEEPANGDMVEDDGTGLGGAEGVDEGEAGVIGGGVVVAGAAGEAVGAETGDGLDDLTGAEGAGGLHVPEEREGVIEHEAGGELPAGDASALVDGPDEGKRPDEVGGEPEEAGALDARLEDEGEVAVLEVADAAVDEAGGAAGSPGGEVLALDEGDAQAAEGGIAGDPAAGDTAADDEEVEELGGESEQALGSRGGRRRRRTKGDDGAGARTGAGEGSGLGDGFRTHGGECNGGEAEGQQEEKRSASSWGRSGVGVRVSEQNHRPRGEHEVSASERRECGSEGE
jgi:hypothetical protein